VNLRSWLAIVIFSLGLLLFGGTYGSGQTQGGGGTAGQTFRVTRSIAGPSGAESNGHLIMEDPRTVFQLGQDRKVIVYFEWEGPVGQHKFEGLWKNTEGKVILVSDFQYTATTKQFSGYWTMLLSGSETPGVWTLEARIDGESAGNLSFQLVAEPSTVPPSTPTPTRQPLAPAELYKQAAQVIVYIDKIDSHGKAVARGSGFYLDGDQVVTAFQNIDGASALRVISADGHATDVTQVKSWNRWQDWAILPSTASKAGGISRAAPNSWSIGSVCYYLETSTGSSRIITDTSIVGENTFPRAGERLNLTASPGRVAIGSPLLNEFGEVIGMVGGSLAPGTDLLGSYMLAGDPTTVGQSGIIRDGLAVPITLIPFSSDRTTVTSLDELAHSGQMLPLLTSQEKVLFGDLALTLEKSQGAVSPLNSRQQFSHQDQKVYVYLSWAPTENFKGVAEMAIFDGDNRSLGQSKPLKVNLHPGNVSGSVWDIPLAPLSPGIYRVDVSLGNDLVWRRFFRLTD
jgi:S1-C subfamily serine protease